MDETKHWKALKSGNMQGLHALYSLHADRLYAYGMILCRDADRVEDCIHDLFLTCWQNHKTISIPKSGKAYLMVSLRRKIFDPGPKSVLQTTDLVDSGAEALYHTTDHEQQWIAEEDDAARQQKLLQAMGRISERQREIIHMKYFEQMDYDDIAAAMDLNYQSARNLVNRALIALRKEMLAAILILISIL
jgi:RNA polymerase sigma factor (sigma-70 family)